MSCENEGAFFGELAGELNNFERDNLQPQRRDWEHARAQLLENCSDGPIFSGDCLKSFLNYLNESNIYSMYLREYQRILDEYHEAMDEWERCMARNSHT